MAESAPKFLDLSFIATDIRNKLERWRPSTGSAPNRRLVIAKPIISTWRSCALTTSSAGGRVDSRTPVSAIAPLRFPEETCLEARRPVSPFADRNKRCSTNGGFDFADSTTRENCPEVHLYIPANRREEPPSFAPRRSGPV